MLITETLNTYVNKLMIVPKICFKSNKCIENCNVNQTFSTTKRKNHQPNFLPFLQSSKKKNYNIKKKQNKSIAFFPFHFSF